MTTTEDAWLRGKFDMTSDFTRMTRAELIRELQRRESYLQQGGLHTLIADLDVHREELQTQNEQMHAALAQLDQERARESESYDLTPIPLITLDRNGYIIKANLTACQFLNTTPLQILGQPLTTFLAAESRAPFRQHLTVCRANDCGITRCRVVLRDRGRGTRSVELRSQPSSRPAEPGVCTAMLEIADAGEAVPVEGGAATERRIADLEAAKAELQRRFDEQSQVVQQLRESEARLRGIVESEMVGIAIWRDDGAITEANQRLLDLLGYTRHELHSLPLRWTSITPTEYASADQAAVDSLRQFGRARPYEKELVRKDGSRVPVLVGVSFVPGSDREVVAYVVDISEQKRTEKALRESESRERQRAQKLRTHSDSLADTNRRKDRFLAMLGHELRNPLGPLTNASDLLRRFTPQIPEACELWDIVERQVGQLSRLVDDLLDVSRISNGRILLKRSTVNLVEVVRQATIDFATVVADAGLTVEVQIPDEPVWVDGDRSRLAQILGNLIHNACKYTDAGGSVHITLSVEAGAAILEVRDTGVGIRTEALGHLFDPFVQEDESLDRSRGGLGLGLALVRGLVEMHGGEVRADSGGIGTGSRFVVHLPVVPGDACTTQPSVMSGGESLRVLVVEDNRDAGFMLRKLLQSLGHEALVAGDGRAALSLAIDFRPDLLLCDIGLPGMDGCAVAQALRVLPELESADYVALSGFGQVHDQQRALEAGFDQYLTKPASTESLKWVLKLAAARRAGKAH